MKSTVIFALFPATALLLATAAFGADPTPLNLKTGEWEYTVTMQSPQMAAQAKQMKQMPQLTPEQLAQIPEAQRAKIEAAMKNAGAAMSGQPTVSKNCVKKEDLSNFNPTEMTKTCKMTVTNSSSSKFEAKVACDDPNNKSSSTIVAEALSPESMKFSVVSAGTMNGQPMNMTINGTGKWLSATCTDAK